jgi:hypothetical protein
MNNNNITWLSLGENCLPDDILKRHNLKSYSSPYAPCRSNIDYVIQAEQENLANLLNPEYFFTKTEYGKEVLRSNIYSCETEIYCPSVSSGFEFTHHDVLNDKVHVESFERKIERWNELRHSKGTVVFLYNHRYTAKGDINKIKQKLNHFLDLYQSEGVQAYVILFYQSATVPKEQRKVKLEQDNHLFIADFSTEAIWAGTNQDIFWARCDDDLIVQMLQYAQNFFEKTYS